MRSQNEGKWQMRRIYITKTEIGEGDKGSATGRERFYLIYPSLYITDIYCVRYSQLNRHNVTMLQPSGRELMVSSSHLQIACLGPPISQWPSDDARHSCCGARRSGVQLPSTWTTTWDPAPQNLRAFDCRPLGTGTHCVSSVLPFSQTNFSCSAVISLLSSLTDIFSLDCVIVSSLECLPGIRAPDSTPSVSGCSRSAPTGTDNGGVVHWFSLLS
ncbi:uncharacterized protein BDZ83DRAFT_225354 [Colletotrichum acutatum]|uniref:Uncharacterized protein n=1 Tax=Glomerella acutata TaxID=27357 RepID=A0AAD8U7F8_GLOAC|nr:uncharacterized protein BDZ83DRAFT_225354 [Colletotrichum acutatum]KAK1704297.1 hypothetical protein BDZ83DRAFT_225354 [Colletotrichum acutatum]